MLNLTLYLKSSLKKILLIKNNEFNEVLNNIRAYNHLF